MDKKKWFTGYEALEKRLNIRNELAKFKKDPLESFLNLFNSEDRYFPFADEIYRYKEAYRFFYLSLERFLPEMSIGIRWRNGPYYALKYRAKYSQTEKKIADQYNKIAKFIEYDFFNCILHSRILLDRAISLSRFFIKNKSQPSYTSFNSHKKFFINLIENDLRYDPHEEYACYIRENTGWFEVPLKIIRDKYLVHAGPQHVRLFGYPDMGHEFSFVVMLPNGDNPEKPLSKIKVISLSVPQLANDISKFLSWLANYGMGCLRENNINGRDERI